MKKTVLNWVGQMGVIVALVMTTAAAAWAQSAGGSNVDKEFERELKLVEALKVYNKQLQGQLTAQGKASREINASINDAKGLDAQVAPLLGKMLKALDQFVNADLPFHLEDRKDSIRRLKALMVNPEATTSSRYRSIMDIYSVELDYGTTYEAYDDVLDIEGIETPVDMLRVGRVGLYYQTKDQKRSGMWDADTKAWVKLDSSKNRDIRKAIKVAAKTVAPELLSLPISAPEGA